MKKYSTLGELLTEYRKLNGISQFDLSARLDVDVRTIIRWESNETLARPEKEKDLVEQTFIPYQVIRNLNAAAPISTYYDFKIRKYSMSKISVGFPSTEALKAHLDKISPRMHSLKDCQEQDIENILKYHHYLYKADVKVGDKIIAAAAKLLPELNMIMYDNAGYYAGHIVVFPIKHSSYLKLREQKMVEGELDVTDLTNYKNEDIPIFYAYSGYADCNENIHYILNSLISFASSQKTHISCGLVVRPDAVKVLSDFGMEVLWRDEDHPVKKMGDFIPTFMEGKIKNVVN
jgi:transcriptional regulator with XRE-family HTH domain